MTRRRVAALCFRLWWRWRATGRPIPRPQLYRLWAHIRAEFGEE